MHCSVTTSISMGIINNVEQLNTDCMDGGELAGKWRSFEKKNKLLHLKSIVSVTSVSVGVAAVHAKQQKNTKTQYTEQNNKSYAK